MKKITRGKLKELYYEKEMGMESISKFCGVDVNTIRTLMRRNGFKLRSQKEAKKAKFFLECLRNGKHQKREEHHNWKGGKLKRKGVWHFLMPEHPKNIQGYVAIYVLIAEIVLGRSLKRNEIIVHLNRNRFDHSPYNLYVCKDIGEQRRITSKEFDLPLSNIL